MSRIPRITVTFLLGLLALYLPGLGQDRALVSSDVVKQLEHNGESTFVVLLREKADLEPAIQIRDWEERGDFVVRRLKRVADTTQAGLRDLLTVLGVEFKTFWIVNAILVTTDDAGLVQKLAARPEVAEIRAPAMGGIPEPVPGEGRTRIEGIEGIEWNIAHIRAPEVWSEYGVTGTGIVVANLDTGVQWDHPALIDQYRGNLGGGVIDHNYNWFDPSEGCGSPSIAPCDGDSVGSHGTRTMGIMVGDDGGANQIGVAPGARWIAARVCMEIPPDPCFMDSVLEAGQWFLEPTDLNGENPQVSLRPHVINNAWCVPGQGDTFYQATVQAWIAADIFPVFAAGNYGPACGSVCSVPDYPESYAVGAFDMNDDLPHWSSRGPSVFGPMKPNITAPGVDIRSSAINDSYSSEFDGTSWAAPHVAGAVALLWSGTPSLMGEIEVTRQLLDQTAINEPPIMCGGDLEENNEWGEGRLDAFAAFEAAIFVFADDFESGDLSAWSNSVP